MVVKYDYWKITGFNGCVDILSTATKHCRKISKTRCDTAAYVCNSCLFELFQALENKKKMQND